MAHTCRQQSAVPFGILSSVIHAVHASNLAPFGTAGALDTIAVRAQATSVWSLPSSAPSSLHFRHHVPLHRRCCPGEFPSHSSFFLNLAVLLQLPVCPAFALARGTSPDSSLSARTGHQRQREQRGQREQRRKRGQEQELQREQQREQQRVQQQEQQREHGGS